MRLRELQNADAAQSSSVSSKPSSSEPFTLPTMGGVSPYDLGVTNSSPSHVGRLKATDRRESYRSTPRGPVSPQRQEMMPRSIAEERAEASLYRDTDPLNRDSEPGPLRHDGLPGSYGRQEPGCLRSCERGCNSDDIGCAIM